MSNKIAPSIHVVLGNIARFEAEVKNSPDLQNRLAYARAWYAQKGATGEWEFGPSKFVGYEGMDAAEYVAKADKGLDGRRTEAQLQQWFTAVDPGSALFDELNAALVALLARYGKAPSTKTRINVVREVYRDHFGDEEPDQNAAIVDLIVAVAQGLPNQHLKALRERLAT